MWRFLYSLRLNDAMAIVFLLGLALSSWPGCGAAFAGVLLAWVPILVSTVACVRFIYVLNVSIPKKMDKQVQTKAPTQVKKPVRTLSMNLL